MKKVRQIIKLYVIRFARFETKRKASYIFKVSEHV